MWKKTSAVLLMVLITFLLLSGCAKTPKSEPKDAAPPSFPKEVIDVAFVTMTTTSPQPLINITYGVFEEEFAQSGKGLNFIPTRSLDNLYPLLDQSEGDPDFVYLPHSAFTTYITETSKFGGSNKYSVIAGSLNLDDVELIARPGIETLADLDGKKVGVANLRYSDVYQLNKALSTYGLSVSTVGGTVEIIWDDIVAKLSEHYGEGRYDAIINFNSDNVAHAVGLVPGSKVFTLNPDGLFGARQPRTWLITKKEIIEKYPQIVKLFLKAHVLATDMAVEKVDELPSLNRESFIGWFADRGADIAEKNPIEKFILRWKAAEATYDPNLAYITEQFEYLEKTGLVKGKTINDFVRIDLLKQVLSEMNRPPLK